ncbi:MAG: FAD:protein FMN transferase ApbE [Planctomycetes bacterium]|nr:FAD:protein FMN transferase ApbE [Planctomycetota bacterium]
MSRSTHGSSAAPHRGKTDFWLNVGLIVGVCLLLAIGYLAFMFFDSREAPVTQHEGQIFGTTWHMVLHWSDSSNYFGPTAMFVAERRMREIDALCSTWRSDSTLARFNTQHDESSFAVPDELASLVRRSCELAEMTGGAFDPTVGSVTKLWQLDEEPNSLTVGNAPSYVTFRDAPTHIGYTKVEVTIQPSMLRKLDPETEIDLSAIAKGYAVDQVYEQIRDARPMTGGMVEIGGEVRVWGDMVHDIAIEAPIVGLRQVMTTVELKNQSIATSGDYRQFREVDGKTVTHIIDPRTGQSIGHDLASVSVVDDSCAMADALATALMVMGPVEGPRFAEEHGLAALFVVREGDAMRVVRSPVWQRDVKERGAMR